MFREIPLGEDGHFGGLLDDDAGAATGEDLDAAGEGGFGAAGALGERAEDAEFAAEEGDGLAGLGPIPLADTDCFVVDGWHGGLFRGGMKVRGEWRGNGRGGWGVEGGD